MAYTALQFLEKIKPMVLEDMKRSGILASLTAAQALIESNKGNSGLAVKGNNLFGIKGTYEGQSVTMPTKEFVNGQYITVNAAFRKYPSWGESIADHSAMFNRMSRYSNLRGLTDYKKACQRVQEDGYATAPQYGKTLKDTIETYHLYDWDNEVISGFPVLTTTGEETAQIINGNPYTEPTKNVKLNSKGNDVRWLQFQLNLYGYKLIIDGKAGNLTIGAVIDFQKKHGLVSDGIVGIDTRTKLKQTLS